MGRARKFSIFPKTGGRPPLATQLWKEERLNKNLAPTKIYRIPKNKIFYNLSFQRLVPNYPDSFIIHTHLKNTLNYVGMIERKLQSYADKLQNLQQMKKDLERQLQITKPDRELDTN